MSGFKVGIVSTLFLGLAACGGGSSNDKSSASSSSSSSYSSSVSSALSSIAPSSSSNPSSLSGTSSNSSVSSMQNDASSSSISSSPGASPSSSSSSSSLGDTASSLSSSSLNDSSSNSSSSSLADSSSSSSSSSLSEASSSSSNSFSSSNSSAASSSDVQTGVFIDSAVAGIGYETTPGGHSGYTNLNGQYQYTPGDQVTFSIGALVFPSVTAKGVVTPVDMAATADPENQMVINIAALLQSLDTDGNPDNGIDINYATASANAQPVNFDQPYADFAASSAVTTLVANSGSSTTALISKAVAVAHLQDSLQELNAASLVGTWYLTGESGFHYVLFILDDQQYATIDYDPSVSNGGEFEYGHYSWDQATGIISVTPESETESGLDAVPPMTTGNVLALDGDTLKLTDADETVELVRLTPNESHPLVGGWSFIEEEDGSLVTIAFTENLYFLGELGLADENGGPGIEFGNYSYDLDTHEISIATAFETNEQWGISHPCAVLGVTGLNDLSCGINGADILQTLTIDGDTLTFISEADTIAEGEEQPVVLMRVADQIDGSIRLKLNVSSEVTAYAPGALVTADGASMQCGMLNEDNQVMAVGNIEVWEENWILSRDPAQPSWREDLVIEFNAATGAITFIGSDPKAPVSETCNPETGICTFFDTYDYEFAAIYDADETTVITGTLKETRTLSWILDNRVSTCIAEYAVTAVRQ